MLRAISVLPMLFAALILRTDRRIVKKLRQGNAHSVGSAIPLHVAPVLGTWRLQRLARAGAICQVGPERYYLEENGYIAYRQLRRRRVLIVISIVIPLILIGWLWLNLR